MEWKDISVSGRRRLNRWCARQVKKNNHGFNIAALIREAPNETELFKRCRQINKCFIAQQETLAAVQLPEAPTEDTSEVCDEQSPESVVVEKIDYATKHKALLSATQIKFNAFNSRTKGRINTIIQTHTEVPISQTIMDAENEAEVIQAIEEIESRVVPVNPEVRMYTVRRVV